MPALDRRVAALEESTRSRKSRLCILIEPMAHRGFVFVPNELVLPGGRRLQREATETPEQFYRRGRAAAFAVSPPDTRVAMVFAVGDAVSEADQPNEEE